MSAGLVPHDVRPHHWALFEHREDTALQEDFIYATTFKEALGILTFVPVVIAVVVAVLLWFFLDRSRFLSGDSEMTVTPNRLPQLYGYTVCLVAIVVALISLSSLIGHFFTLRAPLQGERWNAVTLTSFEAYKATYRTEGVRGLVEAGQAPARDSLSDEELRRQYEALRAARIASSQFEAQKGLVTQGLLLVVAAVLFGIHWTWLRRLYYMPGPSA